MAAFDYEAAKAQYGASRARQMEKEAAASFPAAPQPGPLPAGAQSATGGGGADLCSPSCYF